MASIQPKTGLPKLILPKNSHEIIIRKKLEETKAETVRGRGHEARRRAASGLPERPAGRRAARRAGVSHLWQLDVVAGGVLPALEVAAVSGAELLVHRRVPAGAVKLFRM